MSFPVKKAIGMMAGDKDTEEEDDDDRIKAVSARAAEPEKKTETKTVKVKKRKIKNPWKKKDVGHGKADEYRDKTGEYDQEIYGKAPVEIGMEKDDGPVDKVIEKG